MDSTKITLTDAYIGQVSQRLMAQPIFSGKNLELMPAQKYATLRITTCDGLYESDFVVHIRDLNVEGFKTIQEWLEYALNQQCDTKAK